VLYIVFNVIQCHYFTGLFFVLECEIKLFLCFTIRIVLFTNHILYKCDSYDLCLFSVWYLNRIYDNTMSAKLLLSSWELNYNITSFVYLNYTQKYLDYNLSHSVFSHLEVYVNCCRLLSRLCY
jgi:hypothetical protein